MRGISLEDKKDASLVTWTTRRPRPPSKVMIPLGFPGMSPAVPCVEPGDRVRMGDCIARPSGPDSVSVHASVNGKVRGIFSKEHPVIGTAEMIEIETDLHLDNTWPQGGERKKWEEVPSEEQLILFQHSGLVDTRTLEPLHLSLHRAAGKVHTLVLNACQSEPYLTSSHVLLLAHPLEILKGAEALRRILGAAKVILAVDPRQREVAEVLNSKIYFLKWDPFEVRTLSSLYPQDDLFCLMQGLFGTRRDDLERELAAVAVHDPATVFAAYESVALQKPFFERAVTVGGECVAEAQNVWAPLGTPASEVFKFARGLLRTPAKMLMGGPMRGQVFADLEASLLPSSSALLALPKEVLAEGAESSCIRCRRCGEACPSGLSPAMITLAVEQGDFESAVEWGAEDCTDCGVCSYVCPAFRPMASLMRSARQFADTSLVPSVAGAPKTKTASETVLQRS
ncbi:MAG: RnfABCDGE type electron transport complex subunit C [Candidatus Omnitrophota bacterium]